MILNSVSCEVSKQPEVMTLVQQREFVMKYIVAIMFLIFGINNVKAQNNDCADDQILGIYVDVRDNEIPALDSLSAEDKQKLVVMYQNIIDVVESQLLPSPDGGLPEPRMRNDLNLVNVSTSDPLSRTLALQTDLILSILQAEDRDDLVNTLKEAVTVLNDGSSMTFGEYQDRLNRDIVENALSSYGCPSNLIQDYGISGYIP